MTETLPSRSRGIRVVIPARSEAGWLRMIMVVWLCTAAMPAGGPVIAEGPKVLIPVGVARRDITPDYPVRLSGYAVRDRETDSVAQRIWAKAMAIGEDGETAVLVTVDHCGVTADIAETVARRLEARHGIPRERFAICSSHTHSAPCTTGFAPNIFAKAIPDEEMDRIRRYTADLTAAIEGAAVEAIAARAPATLSWAEGVLGFAANRRTVGGPVDHRLPVLRVAREDGGTAAVLASYACHCTTLGGDFNAICGDWAGFAQEALEREVPGSVAMVAIGCGADSNPHPRHGAEGPALARQHGEALATEARRVLAGPMNPLDGAPVCRHRTIELPYQNHFTRDEWNARAAEDGIVGHHARRWLERLDRGESPPRGLAYPVQVWCFGEDLAMINLGGEVVVDYALRLYREMGAERLWINAYANDVPCYIPSRRILAEGGYEAEGSLWYYDRPQRLAPETEDILVSAVRDLLPPAFDSATGDGGGEDDSTAVERVPPPRDPESALRTIRVTDGYAVELAVSEPLVVDPVAIDWGPDGRLWVAEMLDYPMGLDGLWKPGGRISVLRDTDGDGRYDASTVFLDGLPFPTGVMAWGRGVFVCAAPDILHAEDTDGDGRADRVETWFTGFATDNYQARVNGLQAGLDGWIWGANGLLGGTISAPGTDMAPIELGGRDFRFHPVTRQFEPVTGLSQHGRIRSDWGDWFGCDNGTLAVHFPFDATALVRNPAARPPSDRIFVPAGEDPNRLFPSSPTAVRYNDPGDANRVTSACGIGMQRDPRLGPELAGNLFVCEPVHNLVRRLFMAPEGISWRGVRAPGEERAEFLASTDQWFRPVQVRTGPDGALWVVDMYRHLIEHPRWIQASRLVGIDVRAGTDRGRLYRVVPAAPDARSEIGPSAPRDLTVLDDAELVECLAAPNGTERDRVHVELLHRGVPDSAIEPLRRLAADAAAPDVSRAHAFHLVLDRMDDDALAAQLVSAALGSPHPLLRREALKLAGPLLREPAGGAADSEGLEALGAAVAAAAGDPEPSVRFQAALALGECQGEGAAEALGCLLVGHLDDAWFRAAVVSSAGRHTDALVGTLMELPSEARGDGAGWRAALEALAETAALSGNLDVVSGTLDRLLAGSAAPDQAQAQANALLDEVAAVLRGCPDSLRARLPTELRKRLEMLAAPVFGARDVDPDAMATAVEIVSLTGGNLDPDGPLVERSLAPGSPFVVRTAVLEALSRAAMPSATRAFLRAYPGLGPSQRGELLRVWVGRPTWHGALADAIEAGSIHVGELGSDLIELLRNAGGPDGSLAGRFAALLGPATSVDPAWDENRAEALASAVDGLEGNRDAGRALFTAACAVCHHLRGAGVDLGPDLATMRDRDTGFWIRNVAAPNLAVEPRYLGYLVRLKDGRVFSGVVRDESPTGFRLHLPGGAAMALRRAEVAALEPLGISLMPEGLTAAWSPQDHADLLAFVRSAPDLVRNPPPEAAEANRHAFMESGSNGFLYLFSAAEIIEQHPSWLGPLRLALCRLDGRDPGIVWQTDPVPREVARDAPWTFRIPAAMGFLSQPGGEFRLRVQGRDGAEVRLAASLDDREWRSADGRMVVRYAVRQRNEEDGNGVLEIQVPGAWLTPGQPLTFEASGDDRASAQWFGIHPF